MVVSGPPKCKLWAGLLLRNTQGILATNWTSAHLTPHPILKQFSPHIAKLTQPYRVLLCNVRRIWSLLSAEVTQVLVQTPVISGLDHVNMVPVPGVRRQVIKQPRQRLAINKT